MGFGPVSPDELRSALGGAPGRTDEELQGAIDVSTGTIAPLLAAEYADPATWPAPLHDGVLLGAVLSYRNLESPTAAAAGGFNPDGSPAAPPMTWLPRLRQRLWQYLDPAALVG